MVEGGVVHHEDGLRLRPSAAMKQELCNEILKHSTVGGSLEYACKDDAILCVRWEDLVPLIAVKPSDLHGRDPQWRPSSTPEANALVTSGFINIYQVIGPECGQIVEIEVSKVCVPFQ